MCQILFVDLHCFTCCYCQKRSVNSHESSCTHKSALRKTKLWSTSALTTSQLSWEFKFQPLTNYWQLLFQSRLHLTKQNWCFCFFYQSLYFWSRRFTETCMIFQLWSCGVCPMLVVSWWWADNSVAPAESVAMLHCVFKGFAWANHSVFIFARSWTTTGTNAISGEIPVCKIAHLLSLFMSQTHRGCEWSDGSCNEAQQLGDRCE